MAQKRNSNKESLRSVIDRYIESMKMRDRFTAMDIQKEWKNIMGPSISRHTTEIKLQKKLLIVRIDSSVIRQELFYGREKIVKAVNQHFGREVIKDVLTK